MAKKIKKVVVSQVYLELLERKAALLDEMTYGSEDGFDINTARLKSATQIYKDWAKADADSLGGTEPYLPL